MFEKFINNNYPNNVNYLLIFIVFSITTFIAAMFQNISDYISLISSFYGLFIAVVMPGLIYIKSSDAPQLNKSLALCLIIALCSIGAITIYFTLKKMFNF